MSYLPFCSPTSRSVLSATNLFYYPKYNAVLLTQIKKMLNYKFSIDYDY